jgi:hypothetical protein
MRLVFTTDDAEQFGERVIVPLIGGAWRAQTPFKFVPIDHRAPFRKNIAHTLASCYAHVVDRAGDPRRAIEDRKSGTHDLSPREC